MVVPFREPQKFRNRPEVCLIVAMSSNRVIGRENALPWHIPEDLARFKRLTNGASVIMGRKTWDSLPANVRPLKGRDNVVITRKAEWQAPVGVLKAGSISHALALCPNRRRVFIIGGAQVFSEVLEIADTIFLTTIDSVVDGDAFFPKIDENFALKNIETFISKCDEKWFGTFKRFDKK